MARVVLKYAAVLLAFAGACSGSKSVSPQRDSEQSSQGSSNEEAKLKLQHKQLDKMMTQAEEAKGRGELDTASRLALGAVELAEKLAEQPQRARMLLVLGDVEMARGFEDEARRRYADAAAVYHVADDKQGKFKTYLAFAKLEARVGDHAAAERQFDEAAKLLEEIEEPDLLGEYYLQKGRLASRRVERDKALDFYDKALGAFKKNKEREAETHLLMAIEDEELGHTRQGRIRVERALKLFRDIGDPEGEVKALHRMAVLYERDGSYQKARGLYKDVFELYAKLDDRRAAAAVQRHMSTLPD